MGALLNIAILTAIGMPGATDLRRAGIFVICMILAIGVHEFAHAWMANKLGDPQPEGEGRLTLNPLVHADPIGTITLPLVLGLFGGGFLFGWGRPVMTNPRNYTRKISMRGGFALVAFAGPLSNLLQALVALGLIAGLSAAGMMSVGTGALEHPLLVYYVLNIVLFAFNLIPIHPLDGGKVLGWLLGAKYQHIDDFLLANGGKILLVAIFAPLMLGFAGPIQWLLMPFVDAGIYLLQLVV